MGSHFIFPKPRDWNSFEDLVCDVLSRKYQNRNMQRYGRSGQRQDGVDIVGQTDEGLLGVQCKHHPLGNISTGEIDKEVVKSESFMPGLDEYMIVTSADRDVNIHTHVLRLSQDRQTQGKYPLSVKFWDEIYGWLIEYPDLVYKHFTKYFPVRELEHLSSPGPCRANKATLSWPTTTAALLDSTAQSLHPVAKVTPYTLALGFSTFPTVSFAGTVDLDIQLSDCFAGADPSAQSFSRMVERLNGVKTVISDPYFSSELYVYVQARLSAAFLFGWIFRRVTHHELKLLYNDQIWATSGLPPVPAQLVEPLPELLNGHSCEVAVVLNISRDITRSVAEFVATWDALPRALVSYGVEGHRITSAAHALAVARELARKIKNLFDVSHVEQIHLFGALPAALATLIAYHLNAICPIDLYFMNDERTTYQVGGTLSNNL